MMRKLVTGAGGAVALVISAAAFADQGAFGSAQEARGMLDKAVTAVKADKAKALASFNHGDLMDRDLYPFCFNVGDGAFVAAGLHLQRLIGTDVRALKDPTGKAYGPELYAAAQKADGRLSEVDYMFPRPGADKTPVPKVTFVTRTSDLGCGVGYYK